MKLSQQVLLLLDFDNATDIGYQSVPLATTRQTEVHSERLNFGILRCKITVSLTSVIIAASEG